MITSGLCAYFRNLSLCSLKVGICNFYQPPNPICADRVVQMTRKGHLGIVYYLKRFISFSLIFRGKKRTCPVSEKRNKQMTCLQSHPDIFFFSLPTNQMAVRFQTQGSGRQSRNKIAFLGRRIGLTICQIKGPTHTHIHTNKRLF